MAKLPSQKKQALQDFTEDQAREYLENLVWDGSPTCPKCKSENVYRMSGPSIRPGLMRCRACCKQFTVVTGTYMEGTKVPLRKWVRATHLLCASKKGMSALQMQRMLGLGSYKTAWHMMHCIRDAMKVHLFTGMLEGTVEVDETFVGGKLRGCGWENALSNKVPVVSMVQRDGQKRSVVIPKVTGANLKAVVDRNIKKGSKVYTDELKGYSFLKKEYKHEAVNHDKEIYVRRFQDGTVVTTNTVECSFALVKRSIMGAYHKVSRKHLHRYLAEFDFRWNHRKICDVDRSKIALSGLKGRRPYIHPDLGVAA